MTPTEGEFNWAAYRWFCHFCLIALLNCSKDGFVHGVGGEGEKVYGVIPSPAVIPSQSPMSITPKLMMQSQKGFPAPFHQNHYVDKLVPIFLLWSTSILIPSFCHFIKSFFTNNLQLNFFVTLNSEIIPNPH